MTTRRDFLKVGTLSVAGLLINEHVASAKTSQEKGSFSVSAAKVQPAGDFTSKRPPVAERKFTSEAVEKHLKKSKARIKDPKLAWMFENCYPNTLDTTCEFKTVNGKPDTFVITGDIHAMWLRDSSAQVYPKSVIRISQCCMAVRNPLFFPIWKEMTALFLKTVPDKGYAFLLSCPNRLALISTHNGWS